MLVGGFYLLPRLSLVGSGSPICLLPCRCGVLFLPCFPHRSSSIVHRNFQLAFFRLFSPPIPNPSPSHPPPPWPRWQGVMAEFVRAQIFGTTFEITSRLTSPLGSRRKDWAIHGRGADAYTRYTDLQPVGMGAFGLVWYGPLGHIAWPEASPPKPLLMTARLARRRTSSPAKPSPSRRS